MHKLLLRNLGIILLFVTLNGGLTACASSQGAVIPQREGITIARRGVSMLPTATSPGAAPPTGTTVFTQMPSSTATIAESTTMPTDTPTATQPQPSDTPSPTETLAPTQGLETPSNTPTAEPEVCQSDSNRALEAEIITLINQERVDQGLTALVEQSQLTQSARLHAEDMACNDFFSHESPTNGNVVDRVAAQGYTFSAIGEIIAAGYADSQSVVAGWMESAEHRSNILNADFTQIGVGYAVWDASAYQYYWVVVFGKP